MNNFHRGRFFASIIVLLFSLTLNFHNTVAQQANEIVIPDSIISQYLEDYPHDNYSIRVKRLTNVLNAHSNGVSFIEAGDLKLKSEELDKLKIAIASISNYISKGYTYEKAVAIYKRETQHKSEHSKPTDGVDTAPFSIPGNTTD